MLDTLLCIGHQPALRHAQQLGLCLFLSLQPSKLLQRRMYRGCARVYVLRSDRYSRPKTILMLLFHLSLVYPDLGINQLTDWFHSLAHRLSKSR